MSEHYMVRLYYTYKHELPICKKVIMNTNRFLFKVWLDAKMLIFGSKTSKLYKIMVLRIFNFFEFLSAFTMGFRYDSVNLMYYAGRIRKYYLSSNSFYR